MFAITVVLPVYRNRERVGATIRSLLAQPQVAVRIIAIIDDQCRETEAIIAAFGVETLFNERNMGAPWCRNLGLALTATRHVMFLDSDDYLEGKLLAGLCREMEASGADIGFGRTIQEFEDGRPRLIVPLPGEPGPALFEQWCVEQRCSGTCSVLWDAAFLRSIGGWDETLKRSQDSELVLRALLMGAKSCVSAEGAGIYVHHAEPHRITRRGNLDSSLLAAEKLLAISPAAYPRSTVERAIAARAAQIAAMAFEENDTPVATRAFALARRLGLVALPGRPITRRLIAAIGLRATIRLRRWIAPLRCRLAGRRSSERSGG